MKLSLPKLPFAIDADVRVSEQGKKWIERLEKKHKSTLETVTRMAEEGGEALTLAKYCQYLRILGELIEDLKKGAERHGSHSEEDDLDEG